MSTKTQIEDIAPQQLSQADLKPRGRVYPSPVTWRDQILYQLLPDRFSDGKEDQRPLFDHNNPQQYKIKDQAGWMAQGTKFVGGTLKGVESKLDYLQGLGVTTLWVNPPWKQRKDLETYHGYGIQNFLDIDPRFGTRQDLRDLVDAAHDRGMYVILDIICNHSGNNWFYLDDEGKPSSTMRYRFSPPYPFGGWRSGQGEAITEIVSAEDGAWPKEFQNLDYYTRSGEIGDWGIATWEDPLSPFVEYRRGDFYDLKDFNLQRPEVVRSLAQVYQYWIALSDCDGFRIDAVKHISTQECSEFCTQIREYAYAIGKDNFFLTGEITDGSIAPAYIDILGRNLDAMLGIVEFPNQLTATAKGLCDPIELFCRYEAFSAYGFYQQLGRFIVLVMDDHDMSSRPKKARFAADSDVPNLYQQIAHAVGIQLTIPGIPAIYYGTEQAFDGNEDYHDYNVESRRFAEDRYVREAMFGGGFGAFATEGCHFFNPNHPTYLRIAAIARLRNRQDLIGKALRRGKVYLRESCYLDYPFSLPKRGELMGWSMILFQTEVLMVFNTHGLENRGAQITIDGVLHPQGSHLTYLYNSNWDDQQLRHPPDNQTVPVKHDDDGRATIEIELPPCGMAILASTQ
ncbi:alpha amylase catalytic region [Gloeothece citriformis PCC 7424]|uniref:Alpha amylase catalytic region n=1 Tax=Gloeothece citriformis (strain PCC 7424) TaxID=65393 RepID=B7KIA1_GLOC7|nr:alpha-amylase family glycosyl hydrolase [Gloeothece citriformis]ACK73588.1 alpha amylase catalytic region [Gloeothece citriformis PCC 7424]